MSSRSRESIFKPTGSLAMMLLCLSLCIDPLSVLHAQDKAPDMLGIELQECRKLREEGRFDESFACIRKLFRRDDIGSVTRIGGYELLGELYSIARAFDHARTCYEEILRIDADWFPENFVNLPPSFREPILEALKESFKPGTPGLHNLALLDCPVVDMPSKKKIDLADMEAALPILINNLLHQNLSGCRVDGKPMRVLQDVQRRVMMDQIALQMNLPQGTIINTKNVSRAQLEQSGDRMQVQGFVEATMVASSESQVAVAVNVIAVGEAVYTCTGDAFGEKKNILKLLRQATKELVECICGGEAPEAEPVSEPDAMLVVLESLHRGLVLANNQDFAAAEEELRKATSLAPDWGPGQETLNSILSQKSIHEARWQAKLPSPTDFVVDQ